MEKNDEIRRRSRYCKIKNYEKEGKEGWKEDKRIVDNRIKEERNVSG